MFSGKMRRRVFDSKQFSTHSSQASAQQQTRVKYKDMRLMYLMTIWHRFVIWRPLARSHDCSVEPKTTWLNVINVKKKQQPTNLSLELGLDLQVWNRPTTHRTADHTVWMNSVVDVMSGWMDQVPLCWLLFFPCAHMCVRDGDANDWNNHSNVTPFTAYLALVTQF